MRPVFTGFSHNCSPSRSTTVYVSGVKYGWSGFFLLTLILSVATLAGMEKLKLGFLEKYESGVLGGTLCLLGLLIMLFEH